MLSIRSLLLLGCIISILSGCSSFRSLYDEDVIPLRKFFANTSTKQAYKISPDGTKLAWLEVVTDRLELKVKDLSTGSVRWVKTPFINEKFYWGDSNRFILLPVHSRISKLTKLAQIDTNSNEPQLNILWPELKGSIQLLRPIWHSEFNFIIKHILPGKTEFYLVSGSSEYKKKLELNGENVSDVIVRHDEVSAYIRNADGKRFIEKFDEQQKKLSTVAVCDDYSANVHLLSVDDNGFLNYLSNCESDTLQLISAQSLSKKSYSCDMNIDCQFNFDQVLTHPKSGLPLLAITHGKKANLIKFNNFTGISSIEKLEGKLTIVNYDENFNNIVFESSSYLGINYYVYNTELNQTIKLSEPQLADYSNFLRQAEFVNIKLNASENLYGYYYPSSTSLETNKPAVILMHGGPETRAYPDYDQEALMLSNRGYDVLQLNYRGSKGFGKVYKHQAYENIKVILDDIDIAADWLVKNKGVEKNKIGLMGGSYGGYLTLLASENDQYKCIASINGIYDLQETAKNFPGDPRNLFIRYYGSLDNILSGKYDDYSPIKINNFLNNDYLLIQSKGDDRISFQSAINFYEHVKNNNNVEMIELNDGHVIHFWYNRLKMYRKIEAFFSNCLGGIDGGFEYYLLAKPFYE